jgi:hypothetical protein
MIFPHTVKLIRAMPTESDLGGLGYSWPGPGSSYAAFVQTRTESRAEILETAGAREMTVIYVQGVCPAKPLDRIVFEGVTYEITGSVPARSLAGVHHTKLMAQTLELTER